MTKRDKLKAAIKIAEIEFLTHNKSPDQGDVRRSNIHEASAKLVNAHLELIRSKR